MSGHSKWSTIKRKKGKADAERGKLFTKLIREITIAARQGGGDEATNPGLRAAVEAARAANMPYLNIERAIQRGTGELAGVSYEEVIYEGYGPGGVAVMIEATTDNRNRTVSEIRHVFGKQGGNLGASGSVAWIFQQKGLIVVNKDAVGEDDLMLAALEAGAEDIRDEGDAYEITTAAEDFEKVKRTLAQSGISFVQVELTRSPQTTVQVEGKTAQQTLKLLEALEECDDVQRVFANLDIAEEELAALTA